MCVDTPTCVSMESCNNILKFPNMKDEGLITGQG